MTRTLTIAIALLMLSMSAVQAATVTQFQPLTIPGTPGVWYESDIRGGGTASIVDLTGLGGNLESNQPLPTGAAKLTTGFDNVDKAEVTVFDNFGLASDVLTTGQLGYDYYKQTVAGGNSFAAPSLKLTLFSFGTGNSGTLVYEPSWNQPGGGSGTPPADAWQHVDIDATTGSTDGDNTGGWWWTGGYGVANSFGGPPIRSLSEWETALSADPDFANAIVFGISMGVGTYNQGQVGYFDNVSLNVPGGYNQTFDFQGVPEPSSLVLAGLAIGAATLRRRRRP